MATGHKPVFSERPDIPDTAEGANERVELAEDQPGDVDVSFGHLVENSGLPRNVIHGHQEEKLHQGPHHHRDRVEKDP